MIIILRIGYLNNSIVSRKILRIIEIWNSLWLKMIPKTHRDAILRIKTLKSNSLKYRIVLILMLLMEIKLVLKGLEMGVKVKMYNLENYINKFIKSFKKITKIIWKNKLWDKGNYLRFKLFKECTLVDMKYLQIEGHKFKRVIHLKLQNKKGV